ncbi:MAG: glycosyltransferase family 39 protein [Anaerolineae bacterium]
MALYAIVLLGTLISRLAGLGHFALTGRELQGAVGALSWVRGDSQTGLAYSPLQWLLQAPLFALTRPNEVAARLPTVLAGAALVLVIYRIRHVLGRERALSLAVLAMLSPTMLHLGRQADGAFLGAAAALAATLTTYSALRSGEPRSWRWAAVSVAVGLCAGAGFWTWLLAAILLGVAAWARCGWTPRLVAAGEPLRRQPLLWFGVALLGVSTMLLAHLAGFGAVLELAGDWCAGLRSTEPWFWPLYSLALYEPLLLVLAILGGVRACRTRDGLGLAALFWLGVALLVGLLGHRDAYWLPDMVAPLLLLAAGGVAPLFEAWRQGHGPEARFAAVCLLVLLAFAAMNLLMYAQSNQRAFAWLAAGALLVLAGLWAGFWVWEGRAQALAVGVVLLASVLGAMTVRTAVALGYQTARDPREPLVYDAVALSPQQMGALVGGSSLVEAGDMRTLDIAWAPEVDLEARWYLRQMHDARPMDPAGWPDAEALLVAPAADELPPAGYVGQRLFWRVEWTAEGLPASDWLRWLLLREPVGWESGNTIALWYRFER